MARGRQACERERWGGARGERVGEAVVGVVEGEVAGPETASSRPRAGHDEAGELVDGVGPVVVGGGVLVVLWEMGDIDGADGRGEGGVLAQRAPEELESEQGWRLVFGIVGDVVKHDPQVAGI